MATNQSAGPVLVAVDFSPYSVAALRRGAEEARSFEVPLHVLHVVHDPESAPGYYNRTDSGEHLRRLQENAEIMLGEFLARVRSDYPEVDDVKEFSSELVVGLPAGRILEVAERIGAGSIVMGSQGRTGVAHLLLGSKAEQVVRLAPIPVTIVKAEPAPGEYKGGDPARGR